MGSTANRRFHRVSKEPTSIRLAVLFFLICSIHTVYGLTFTSPLFENLNLEQIERELSQSRGQQASASASKDLILQLFQAEAYLNVGQIHYATDLLKQIQEYCKSVSETQAYLTCSIGLVMRVPFTLPQLRWKLASQALTYLEKARKAGAQHLEILYAEGRVFSSLPPPLGQKVGRSQLAWNILLRLQPQVSSPLYWMARTYQREGLEEKAEEYFNLALNRNPPDSRTLALFSNRQFRRKAEHLDTPAFGFRPGLYYSPSSGFGGFAKFFDDRLWDKKQKGLLSLGLTTRGNVEAAIGFEDREWLPPVSLSFQTRYRYAQEDFFGIGMSSEKESRSVLRAHRFDLEVEVSQPFLDFFFLNVGWRYAHWSVKSVDGGTFNTENLIGKSNVNHLGIYGELGWDTRDSRWGPYRGSLLKLSGYFPTEGLGSEHTFMVWSFLAEQYLMLSRKHHFSFTGFIRGLEGRPPYPEFSRLSGSIDVPGVRKDRFQDKQLFVAWGRYRYRLSRPLSILAFVAVGRVSNRLGKLFELPVKAGGGGGLQWHASHQRSESLQLETGYFANEFVLKVTAGVRF